MKKLIHFGIIYILLFTSCGETKLKPQIDESIKSEELPDQESSSAQITFTEEGKLRAILYSDNIKVLGNKKEKGCLFFASGRRASTKTVKTEGRGYWAKGQRIVSR